MISISIFSFLSLSLVYFMPYLLLGGLSWINPTIRRKYFSSANDLYNGNKVLQEDFSFVSLPIHSLSQSHIANRMNQIYIATIYTEITISSKEENQEIKVKTETGHMHKDQNQIYRSSYFQSRKFEKYNSRGKAKFIVRKFKKIFKRDKNQSEST